MTINIHSDCKFSLLRWILFFVIIGIAVLYFSDYALDLYKQLARDSDYVNGHRQRVTCLKYFINLFPSIIPSILYCAIFLPKLNTKTASRLFWIAPLIAFLTAFLTGFIVGAPIPIFYILLYFLFYTNVILAAAIYLIFTLKFNTPYIFAFVLIGGILNGYEYVPYQLSLQKIGIFVFIIFYLFNIAVGACYILKHRRIQFKYLMILIIGIGLSALRIYLALNLLKLA